MGLCAVSFTKILEGAQDLRLRKNTVFHICIKGLSNIFICESTQSLIIFRKMYLREMICKVMIYLKVNFVDKKENV